METLFTDDDISLLENRLGGSLEFSDKERSTVLKFMASCDVQACPGSGKTTLLAAKLILLSTRLSTSRTGICTLSHTNAACKEIEKHVIRHAPHMAKYPNFLGTIQQFVDRFIAIPAMLHRHGVRPTVDDVAYTCVARKHYYSVVTPKERVFLANKASDKDDGFSLLEKARHSFNDPDRICRFEGGTERALIPDVSDAAPTSLKLASIKQTITSSGTIGFHDAYTLAHWYVREFPAILRSIASRFRYIFVDEMQDTDTFQKTFLDLLVSQGSILQCYGDLNQAIYGSVTVTSPEATWSPLQPLQITHSMRLSPSIARLAHNVCNRPTIELRGNDHNGDHSHSIFVFDEGSAPKVIPAFANLIVTEGLHLRSKPHFAAVGAVQKQDSQFPISRYLPGYETTIYTRPEQPSLFTYFELARIALFQTGSFGAASEHLTMGLAQLLKLEGKRDLDNREFTATGLITTMRRLGDMEFVQFRSIVANWCIILADQVDLDWKLVIKQVTTCLAPILTSGVRNQHAVHFLRSERADVKTLARKSTTVNLYRHPHDGGEITVSVGTIHSVKGQTHTATLLLDTFWHDFNVASLVKYLYGKRTSEPGKRERTRLNWAYVAMTRPTHLLCLAIRQQSMASEDIDNLTSYGWTVRHI